MEVKNLNLVPTDIGQVGPSAPARIEQEHMEQGEAATMDVTGSLRKISRELLELKQEDPDLMIKLEGASWLVNYIADCLDVELQHAVARGRKLASEMNGNVQVKGPSHSIIRSEDI